MSVNLSAPSRIALVTGASRGLGRNAAQHIARAGIDVIVTYLTNRAAADLVVREVQATGRKAAALKLDTGNVGSFDGFVQTLEKTINEWGNARLYALVNNAGVGLRAPFFATTEESFDHVMNVNFKGVYFLTQKLLPLIADGGRIVNVSSGLARVTSAGFSVYGPLKGALELFTRYLAKELGPRRIVVNAVAPGGIESELPNKGGGDKVSMNEWVASQTSLGRAGVPDDIGPIIAALLLESHGWINAQTLDVSGGSFL